MGPRAVPSRPTRSGNRPTSCLTRPPDIVAPIEQAAGIVLPPVLQYALIENALGSDEHLSAEEQRDQIAELWARFNAVAAHNPEAAFPEPRSAAEIATPAPGNRPLAYPYNRWHASQWTVDQSSALVICSAEQARAAGVPPERWLFPHVALHCSEAVTLTARRRLSAWPAMTVLGRTAEHHIGPPLRERRLAEVYSCFPAAVRVQQRALGLDPAGTPTLTGGMSFAGGPFNHFVLQSMGTLGRRLRDEPEELGLVTTVSGMLSKPGLALWSASPPRAGRGPLLADLAQEAMAAIRRRPGGRAPTRRAHAAPRWPPIPSPTAARRGSSRSARPSWRTCPMGSAPPPPAKMHRPPASPSPRGSSGGWSR